MFLSARPHVYKDMSESKSYAKFKKLQVSYCERDNGYALVH